MKHDKILLEPKPFFYERFVEGGYNNRTLSIAAGVSDQSVYRMRNSGCASVKIGAKLAKALGYPVVELFYVRGVPKKARNRRKKEG